MGRDLRTRRRGCAAALALGVALTSLATACEVTTDLEYDCPVIGRQTVVVRSNVTPDAVAPGGVVTHELETRMPVSTVDVPADRVTVRMPLPDHLAEVRRVDFTGGNVAGSWAVEGRTLVLVHRADGTSYLDIRLPTVRLEGVVHPAAPGGTMAWPAASPVQVLVDFLGNPIEEVCTAPPGTPELNNTHIDGPANPSWTVPATVGSPPSATTWPPRPTTTTTALPPSPTTTTGPTTTTKPGPGAPPADTELTLPCSDIPPAHVVAGTTWTPAVARRGETVAITTFVEPTNVVYAMPTMMVQVRYRIPAALAIDEVLFSPGTTARWRVEGGELIVEIAGGGRYPQDVTYPATTIVATVADDAGSSIELLAPHGIGFLFALDPPRVTSCTTNAPITLATIPVA